VWVAAVAGWLAVGAATTPELAGELTGLSVTKTLASWCNAAFAWYDPRDLLCRLMGDEVGAQAAAAVKRGRWGRK